MLLLSRIHQLLKLFLDFRGNSVWKLKLPPTSTKGPYIINATSIWQKKNVSAILENVLFGDVWVCSGQSNMAFTVGMVSGQVIGKDIV